MWHLAVLLVHSGSLCAHWNHFVKVDTDKNANNLETPIKCAQIHWKNNSEKIIIKRKLYLYANNNIFWLVVKIVEKHDGLKSHHIDNVCSLLEFDIYKVNGCNMTQHMNWIMILSIMTAPWLLLMYSDWDDFMTQSSNWHSCSGFNSI